MIESLPNLGKIHPRFFDQVIYPRLGARDASVLFGPRHGLDYGVVKIGDQVMALSIDPWFIVPAYGWRRAAWFAFHIIVGDVAVSGLAPRYLAIDLNLPPEMTEADLSAMWATVHAEAERYGISIVTGHTARYTGCHYPMVGGATVIGIGSESELRGPHRVRPGDRVVITKGPAIEATGLLVATFPGYFRARGGEEYWQRADALFERMTVLEDAAIGRSFPGMRVMHDATECGVWGGLVEMAQAGAYGLRIHQDRIPIHPDVAQTCRIAGIDPYTAISEGTLLAVVAPAEADALLAAWHRRGVDCADIGEVVPATAGVTLVSADGETRPLVHPKVDPFWAKFDELSAAGEK